MVGRRLSNSAELIQRHKPGAGIHSLHRVTTAVILCILLQISGICGAIALFLWVHPVPGIVFGTLILASLTPPLAWLIGECRREVAIWRLEKELEQREDEAEARKQGAYDVELAEVRQNSGEDVETGRKFQKKGGLQFEWLNMMNKDPDPAGLNGASSKRKITMEEVQQHASEDDIWMIIRGKVYNVTPYVEYHPGGVRELMRGAGADGTALYNEIHPWIDIGLIGKLQVGNVEKNVSRTTHRDVVLDARVFRPITISHKSWTNKDVLRLRFDLGESKTLGLACGQHVTMRLGPNNRIERQYTPVSDPKAKGTADFLIKVYENGVMGQALAKLNVGDTVEMVGPRGGLIYHGRGLWSTGSNTLKLQAPHVVMCGAGSGITPMLQIIKYASAEWKAGRRTMKIHLLSCGRTEADILCREELEDLANTFPESLAVRFVLSQPSADSETWRTPKANIVHFDGRLNSDILREIVMPLLPRSEESRGRSTKKSEAVPVSSMFTGHKSENDWASKKKEEAQRTSLLSEMFEASISLGKPENLDQFSENLSLGKASTRRGTTKVKIEGGITTPVTKPTRVSFLVEERQKSPLRPSSVERQRPSRSSDRPKSPRVTAEVKDMPTPKTSQTDDMRVTESRGSGSGAEPRSSSGRGTEQDLQRVGTTTTMSTIHSKGSTVTHSTSRTGLQVPILGFVCGPEGFNQAVQSSLVSLFPPNCMVHVF